MNDLRACPQAPILLLILHGGQKVVPLISFVENFGEIQAILMKLGDFS